MMVMKAETDFAENDFCYTILASENENDKDIPSENEFKTTFENGSIYEKTEALKKLIKLTLTGVKYPNLLMTIIRFVMPVDKHLIKKLLYIFWEIWPKYDAEGKMTPEMILVCDAFRKDITHPNEYISGHVLRFLCKLNEVEIIEPLIFVVRQSLERKHPYVRRNAILAVYKIYLKFQHLIPDAPDLLFNILETEKDNSCIIEGFKVLRNIDPNLALDYITANSCKIIKFDELMQLLIVEFIYSVSLRDTLNRSKFIKFIVNLLKSHSPAVRYESCIILTNLANINTCAKFETIKQVCKTYIELVASANDYNVKLISLQRISDLLKDSSSKNVLKEMAMDFIPLLNCESIDVKSETLEILLELVTFRTIGQIIMYLKKEAIKAGSSDMGCSIKYRKLLVKTLHRSCLKYPEFANSVATTLIEFLSEMDESTALDVLGFVRELIVKIPEIKSQLMKLIIESFSLIISSKVHTSALWILGEFSNDINDIEAVLKTIHDCIGSIPIVPQEEMEQEIIKTESNHKNESKNVIMSDGSYATQSAYTAPTTWKNDGPCFLKYFLQGDFEVVSSLAFTFVKLAMKYQSLEQDAIKINQFFASCMLILVSVAKYGTSRYPTVKMLDSDLDFMGLSLKHLSNRNVDCNLTFLNSFRDTFKAFLKHQELNEKKNDDFLDKNVKFIGERIDFKQLKSNISSTMENQFDATLIKAIGAGSLDSQDKNLSKLNKIKQLTGFADPVYSEAFVNVNQYDVLLDILVVNQTNDTLQNLTVELMTMGNLKIVEKPTIVSVGPHATANLKATLKVSSTENCIIFGDIVYSITGSEELVIILNDIAIEVMDYIIPSHCDDEDFRKMWIEFEWENKISVNTNIVEPLTFLQHLIKSSNLKCLTPMQTLKGNCDFLTANLYAKSILGDDILANLSIEKKIDENDQAKPVTGHVRIRAKRQGVALSLGDRIASVQKLPDDLII